MRGAILRLYVVRGKRMQSKTQRGIHRREQFVPVTIEQQRVLRKCDSFLEISTRSCSNSLDQDGAYSLLLTRENIAP